MVEGILDLLFLLDQGRKVFADDTAEFAEIVDVIVLECSFLGRDEGDNVVYRQNKKTVEKDKDDTEDDSDGDHDFSGHFEGLEHDRFKDVIAIERH